MTLICAELFACTPDGPIILKNGSQEITETMKPALFALYSNRLRNERRLNQNFVPIVTEKVSGDAFRAWVKACQQQHYLVTAETAPDLLLLSQRWQTDTVNTDVLGWTNDHTLEVVGPSIRTALANHLDTRAHEAVLRDNLMTIITDETLRQSILDLPDAILERAISWGNWSREEAATIVNCFRGKSEGLFASLDLSDLDEARLREIGAFGDDRKEAFRTGFGGTIYLQNQALKAARAKR
jgi:hypothetical protein